jgi:hypothetical protein
VIILSPVDPRVSSKGLAEWVDEGGWWRPWRLPSTHALPIHPELAIRAQMPAGARIEFTTDADSVELDIEVAPAPGPQWPIATVEILVDGELTVRQHVTDPTTVTAAGLTSASKLIEIWLPHFGLPRVGAIRLPDGASVQPVAQARPRWTVYGSSITQCKETPDPTQTWPALVARAQGWDLRCLGFGGQCHLDPVVARLIRDTPADFIHLCIGINVYGAATFSPRSLAPAIVGFISTIRDGHPDTPITVSTPIVSPTRESTVNAVGWTLADVRAEVATAVVELATAVGDTRLSVIDGTSLIGLEDAHLLHDGLHPSDAGYRVLGDRLTPYLTQHDANAHNPSPSDGR